MWFNGIFHGIQRDFSWDLMWFLMGFVTGFFFDTGKWPKFTMASWVDVSWSCPVGPLGWTMGLWGLIPWDEELEMNPMGFHRKNDWNMGKVSSSVRHARSLVRSLLLVVGKIPVENSEDDWWTSLLGKLQKSANFTEEKITEISSSHGIREKGWWISAAESWRVASAWWTRARKHNKGKRTYIYIYM